MNKPRILSPTVDAHGYVAINIFVHGARKNRKLHIMVAEAFLGPRPDGMDVNHIDGVKTNNKVDNLEWCTRSQNVKHSFDLGLHVPVYGDRHGRSAKNRAKFAAQKGK